MKAQRLRTDKVTAQTLIASHSRRRDMLRDVSRTRMDAVCHNITGFCPYTPPTPPTRLLTGPNCRTGCTFIPEHAHTTPSELLWPFTKCLRYRHPTHPPCQLLTRTHRYLPVSAHLTQACRRPRSCLFLFDFVVCPTVYLLCSETAAARIGKSRKWARHVLIHRAGLHGWEQLKGTRDTCTQVWSWFGATSFVPVHRLLLWSLLFLFFE